MQGPRLGKGAFGMVYRARHNLDGVEYAVKKVRICDPVYNRIAWELPHARRDVPKYLMTAPTGATYGLLSRTGECRTGGHVPG